MILDCPLFVWVLKRPFYIVPLRTSRTDDLCATKRFFDYSTLSFIRKCVFGHSVYKKMRVWS